MFALICGFLPFEHPDTTELYKKILKGDYHIPSFVGKQAHDLLSKIMVHDPKKRLTPSEIRRHEWFQKMHKPVCDAKGLIVGYTHMLYEEQILTMLEEKGF
jgi:5'-AMP-activated protein kinase catalytic alpha subunit